MSEDFSFYTFIPSLLTFTSAVIMIILSQCFTSPIKYDERKENK